MTEAAPHAVALPHAALPRAMACEAGAGMCTAAGAGTAPAPAALGLLGYLA